MNRKRPSTTSIVSGIDEQYSTQIIQLLQSFSGTEWFLFGSRAKGNYREGSDIDIAVKGRGFSPDDRDKLLEYYYQLNLPWKLDVVIYSDIQEPALKKHIDEVGLRITN